MNTFNTFSIGSIWQKSVDFFKAHYEYILPFSFIYFILQLPSALIKSAWTLPFTLLLLPLSFSVSYFAHKVETGTPQRFGLFFEVYTYFFKFFGINLLRYLIILLLFIPVGIDLYSLLEPFNYDAEAMIKAIQQKQFALPSPLLIKIVALSMIALVIYPFLLFQEYFAILDDQSIFAAFKNGFLFGAKNYFRIIGVVLIAFAATFAGMCTCGFGLIATIPFVYLMLYFAYREGYTQS